MGIEVWRLRRPLIAGVSADTLRSRERAPRDATRPSAVMPESVGPAAQPARDSSGAEAIPGRSRESGSAVAPFTVYCLRHQNAVLLMAPENAKAGRRFAADLLAALTGVWGGEVAQLVFAWPQAGLEDNAASAGRALGAFVGRVFDDNTGGITLVSAEVLERLGPGFDLPAEGLLLPPIDELMVDGEKKRLLWRDIESRLGS